MSDARVHSCGFIMAIGEKECMRCEPIEASHKDEGKPGIHYLLGMKGLDQVARVGDFGAKKYSQWNYKIGMPWMKLLGSCARHLTLFVLGEDNDPESKLPHLAHMVYDGLMLLDYQARQVGTDDRYHEIPKSSDNLSY